MKLLSQITSGSESFRANRAAHEEMLAAVAGAAAQAAAGGGEKALARHVSRGKLLRFRRGTPGE